MASQMVEIPVMPPRGPRGPRGVLPVEYLPQNQNMFLATRGRELLTQALACLSSGARVCKMT